MSCILISQHSKVKSGEGGSHRREVNSIPVAEGYGPGGGCVLDPVISFVLGDGISGPREPVDQLTDVAVRVQRSRSGCHCGCKGQQVLELHDII